jgi:hypothetical protein
MRDKVKDEIKRLATEMMMSKLEDLGIVGEDDYNWFPNRDRNLFEELQKKVKKLEDITNANDYEYITETKLVKKNKKGKNDIQ